MTSEVLTKRQSDVLNLLMKLARAVKNTELKEFKLALDAVSRDKLKDLRLIEVGKSKNTITLTLTETGLEHCMAPPPVPPLPRPASGGPAIGLTPNESLVLLVLMTQASEVPNSELKLLGPTLSEPSRKKLEKLGLITVDKTVKPMTLSLADRGWAHCTAEFGTEAPPASTSGARAVYTMLYALNGYLESHELLPNEVFTASHPKPETIKTIEPTPDPKVVDPPPPRNLSIEDRIRNAYASIAQPGRWASLADLRTAVPDIAKFQLDEALILMNRTSTVSLLPEENKKSLTQTVSTAAVKVAGEDHHYIMIERA